MKNFQDMSASDGLQILRRRLGYLIITTIVAAVAAGIYVWQLPSIYKSETAILVADRILPEDYIGSITRDSVTSRIEFVRQQLRSRTFLEKIVQEFQLAGGAGASPTQMDEAIAGVAGNTDIQVFGTNTLRLGFFSPNPARAQAITRRLSEAVIQMNQNFRKEKVDVIDQFLDEQLRLAEAELTDADRKLQQFQHRNFEGAALDPAVSLNRLVDLQGQLSTARSELQNAQDAKTSIERRLQEHRNLKTVMQTPAPRPAPAKRIDAIETALQQRVDQKVAEYDNLSSKYTKAYPDVVRVAREAQEAQARLYEYQQKKKNEPVEEPVAPDPGPLEKIMSATPLGADFEQAEIELELQRADREVTGRSQVVKDMSTKIQQVQARLSPTPEIGQELNLLMTTQDAARQKYSYLSGRKNNAQLAASVDTNEKNETFKVIDEPNLPTIPVRPNRPMMAMLGAAASLLLGFGVAFLREYIDPSLMNEDEAATELKMPILMIPEFTLSKDEMRRGRARQRTIPIPSNGAFDFERADLRVRKIIDDPVTMAGEQFRLVRARLSALQKERGVKTILITSSIPGEGKTFIACCLAGILAREPGKRVLLIDGDLRTQNVHRTLGMDTRNSQGLVEMLRGQTDPRTLMHNIKHCSQNNLYYLPAGQALDNPAELLSSPKLEALIHDLAPLFDWILIDSTPVLHLADANLTLPLCDATLLVACAGKTPSKFIKNSIEKIGQKRTIGVLLNRVRSVTSAYYYAPYYRSSNNASRSSDRRAKAMNS